MFKFLTRLFPGEKSGDVAKERLQLVLIHDRNDIAPEKLEALKVDMVRLLKKYLEIDETGIKMNLERRSRSVALVADIPLKKHCFPASARMSSIASIVSSADVVVSKMINIIVESSALKASRISSGSK